MNRGLWFLLFVTCYSLFVGWGSGEGQGGQPAFVVGDIEQGGE